MSWPLKMRAGEGEFLFWQAERGTKENLGRPAPGQGHEAHTFCSAIAVVVAENKVDRLSDLFGQLGVLGQSVRTGREVACYDHDFSGRLVDGVIEPVPRSMAAKFEVEVGEPGKALCVIGHGGFAAFSGRPSAGARSHDAFVANTAASPLVLSALNEGVQIALPPLPRILAFLWQSQAFDP